MTRRAETGPGGGLVAAALLALGAGLAVAVRFARGWDPLALADPTATTWGDPTLFVRRSWAAARDVGHASFAANLVESLAATAAFTAFVALCVALGERVRKRLGLDGTRAERFVFDAGLGLGGASLGMTLLGLAQLWSPAAIRAALGATAIALFVTRSRPRTQPSDDDVAPTSWTARIAVVVCGVAVVTLAAVGLVPQSFYDALVYHHGVPNRWLQDGGIGFLPGHFFSNFPLAHGALGVALRCVGPDVTIGLLQPFCLAVTLVALGCARRRLAPRSRVPLEAFVLLAARPLVENAPRAGNDVYVMTAFALGMLAFVRWRETRASRWVVALGVMLGAAVSAKYSAAAYAPIVALVVAVVSARRGGARAVAADVARLVVGALVLPLPWLVKNAVFTGNPVWPLLPHVFPTRELPDATLATATRLSASLVRDGGDLAALAWTASLTTGDIEHLLGPAFLIVSPCALVGLLLVARRTREAWLYAGALVAAWTVWGVTFRPGRLASPVMAATALLASVAIHELLARLPRRVSASVAVALTTCLWLLTSYFVTVEVLLHGAPAYHAGAVDRRAYMTSGLASGLPNHAQPLFDAVDALDADAKVLVLGDHRTFGLRRRHASATVYDPPLPARYAEGTDGVDAIAARLRADGVTHIAVNLLEGARLQREFDVFGTAPTWQSAWTDFWRARTDAVEVAPGMVLAEITAPDAVDRRRLPDPLPRIRRAAGSSSR